MFVVRITDTDDVVDFKAFSTREDAKKLFLKANRAVSRKDLNAAAWFEAPGTDNPGEAIQTVKSGKAIVLDRDLMWHIGKDFGDFVREKIADGTLHPKSGPE